MNANTKNNKVLAIIPGYKEEKNIARVVAELKRYDFDILVVNDASPDKTREEAEKAGATVVTHPYNMGYAVALQTGYKYALKNNYDTIIQLDGDGQHNPADSQAMLEHLRKNVADAVIGSRFLGVGDYKMQGLRFFAKSFFCLLIKLITGKTITDPTSGYQALSKRILKLYSTDVFADEYPDADMLILAIRSGYKIEELGIAMRHNDTGQSMHSGVIKPAYYIARMLIGVFMASSCKIKEQA